MVDLNVSIFVEWKIKVLHDAFSVWFKITVLGHRIGVHIEAFVTRILIEGWFTINITILAVIEHLGNQ